MLALCTMQPGLPAQWRIAGRFGRLAPPRTLTQAHPDTAKPQAGRRTAAHLRAEGEPLLYVGQRALQHGLQRRHGIGPPPQLLLQDLGRGAGTTRAGVRPGSTRGGAWAASRHKRVWATQQVSTGGLRHGCAFPAWSLRKTSQVQARRGDAVAR